MFRKFFAALLLAQALSAAPLPPQLPHPSDAVVSQQPLGALWTPAATTFRVFAPSAPQVSLTLHRPWQRWPMKKNGDGTWEVKVPGNLQGRAYTYFCRGREVIDPYARCLTGHAGQGLVVAPSRPVGARPSFPPQDAVIYELHLRDFTLDPDSLIQCRGKYLGLTEGKRHLHGHPEIPTGLDHLSELGVNTVQILPLCEFQSDEQHDVYGWGYDSLHFNSPEGWYATRRDDLTRVQEFRAMVTALHQRGIRVIMDMVYNHTMENRFKNHIYSFEGLEPGYYYRRKPDGSYYDGSAVGNEFRSEAPMARRFILDSCRYWVEEMGVDGFRFDLMGLIDAQTMSELTRELKAKDPNLLIYGEPWAASTTPIEITGKGKQRGQGYAVFNDDFRDGLKGSVFQPQAKGFVQDGSRWQEVVKGISGSIDSFADSPLETLNYVECHDNHTLWDRLSLSAPEHSLQEREAMDRLAAAIVFTSQGIPFIQAGQEFRRSKGGEDNSYNLPDAVNMLRWQDKLLHQNLYQYYRGLIHLRQAHPLLRQTQAQSIRESLHLEQAGPGRIVYELSNRACPDGWQQVKVWINATPQPMPLEVAGQDWRLYIDSQQVHQQGVAAIPQEIPPRSLVLLAR